MNFFRRPAVTANRAVPRRTMPLGSGTWGPLAGPPPGPLELVVVVALAVTSPVFVNCVEKTSPPLLQFRGAQLASSPKAARKEPTGRVLVIFVAELPLKFVVLIDHT